MLTDAILVGLVRFYGKYDCDAVGETEKIMELTESCVF